jgi:succinoglycan biosynthesis transport protein ExoP
MSTASTRPSTDPRSTAPRSRAPQAATSRPPLDPIRVLRQRAWLFAASAVVGIGLGGVATVIFDFAYPLYSGSVLFELAPSPEDVGDVIVRDQRTEEGVERLGTTEAGRILSRDILERAMNDRDIAQTTWSEKYRDENGQFVVADAVDDLEKELSAGHRRRTNFFALSWSTHVAADVPVVLNRIARTYLETKKSFEDAKFEANRATFRKALDELDDELETVSKNLTEFVTKNNLTSTSEDRNDLLLEVEDTARRVNETKSLLTLAASRKAQTEAKMEGRLEPTQDDIRTAEADPMIQQANSQVQDLRVAAETYRKKFGAGHNALRTMEKQVKAAELERDAKLQQILRRNLNADFKTYTDQVESYTGLLEKFEKDLDGQGTRLKDFTANLTTVQELKERRERLLGARAEQLKVIANVDQLKAREDARAVQVAKFADTPREKSFPKIKVMLPLGGLLTLAVVVGIVFLREFLDTRIRYATDLAGIPNLRLLGTVPDLAEDPLGPKKIERVVRDAPKSVAAEVCRQLAGQVLKGCTQGGVKTLAVFGGLPEAGTTSLVTNLADSFAAGGRKVLVVDANFRRSHLAAAMGGEPDSKGLGDVLKGNLSLADAIRPAGGDVDLLSAGSVEHRVYELLTTPRMDEVLAEAASRYDLVILDLPPAVVAGDALALANKVDGTLLVVRAFQEQRGLVMRVAAQLNDVRGHPLGVVLNRPRNTAGGYLRKNYEVMAGYAGKA